MPHPDIRGELSKAQADPLLRIERQLVSWSLGIGIVLLIGFTIVNHYFPVTL